MSALTDSIFVRQQKICSDKESKAERPRGLGEVMRKRAELAKISAQVEISSPARLLHPISFWAPLASLMLVELVWSV